MAATYHDYLRGTATREEMERANAVLRDYLKIAGVGTLLILPGAPLTIPSSRSSARRWAWISFRRMSKRQ